MTNKKNLEVPKLKVLPYNYYGFLKDEIFFDFKEWKKILPEIRVWFIKARKNVGKTYCIQQYIKEKTALILQDKKEKICFGRYSRDELIELKNSMETDNSWSCFAQKNKLYDKTTKKHIGNLFYLKGKGLQKFTSTQFSDYSTIIIDEYSPIEQDNSKPLTIARNFIRFINDVQRNKKEIEVIGFANNNTDFDPFSIYFNSDFTKQVQYDNLRQVALLNLKDFYIGIKENITKKLIDYDPEFKRFMLANNSGDLTSDIYLPKYEKEATFKHQIIYNGNIYLILQAGKFILVKQQETYFTIYKCYGFELKDLTNDSNIIPIKQNSGVLSELMFAMLSRTILYNSPDCKKNVVYFVQPTYRERFYTNYEKN